MQKPSGVFRQKEKLRKDSINDNFARVTMKWCKECGRGEPKAPNGAHSQIINPNNEPVKNEAQQQKTCSSFSSIIVLKHFFPSSRLAFFSFFFSSLLIIIFPFRSLNLDQFYVDFFFSFFAFFYSF